MRVSELIRTNDIKTWKVGDTITIKAPTGSGKSYFIKNILYAFAKKEGKKILLLVHRDNCRNQFYKELKRDNKLDIIDIKTYQYLESHRDFDFKEYQYIIADEFHYFTSDSAFNYKTDLSLNMILNQSNSIKIFMSATSRIITSYFKHMKINSIDYEIPINFNWIDKLHIYSKDSTLIDICRECIEKNKKMMIFMDSAEKAYELYKIYKDNAVFNCSKSNKLYKYVNTETIDKVLENEKFESNLFVTTTCMDTGVNIKDNELQHILLDIKDLDQLAQCLGRKRRCSDESIHVYIKNHSNQVLGGIKSHLNKAIKMVLDLNKMRFNKFIEKYSRSSNADERKYYNSLIYDDLNGNKKINQLMLRKIIDTGANIDLALGNKEKNIKPIYYKGLLKYYFNIDYWNIIDIEGKREGETLKDYLENILGKKLYKKEQTELINMFGLKDSRGRLQKSIGLLNEYLKENKLNYIILPKKSNNKRYWVVDNIDIG